MDKDNQEEFVKEFCDLMDKHKQRGFVVYTAAPKGESIAKSVGGLVVHLVKKIEIHKMFKALLQYKSFGEPIITAVLDSFIEGKAKHEGVEVMSFDVPTHTNKEDIN